MAKRAIREELQDMDPFTGPAKMVCRNHHFATPRRLELWYFWCDHSLYVTRLVLFSAGIAVLRHDYPTGASAWKVFSRNAQEICHEIYVANMECSVMHYHAQLAASAHLSRCCIHCGVMLNY